MAKNPEAALECRKVSRILRIIRQTVPCTWTYCCEGTF